MTQPTISREQALDAVRSTLEWTWNRDGSPEQDERNLGEIQEIAKTALAMAGRCICDEQVEKVNPKCPVCVEEE